MITKKKNKAVEGDRKYQVRNRCSFKIRISAMEDSLVSKTEGMQDNHVVTKGRSIPGKCKSQKLPVLLEGQQGAH